MRMANQRGFFGYAVRLFQESFQSSGGPREEEGFDLTHLIDSRPLSYSMDGSTGKRGDAVSQMRAASVNHIHIRIHRWVIWWLCLGIVFGAIALVNILFRELTRTQEKAILLVGIVHWALGGVVCWAFESIKISPAPPPEQDHPSSGEAAREWHPASDFVLPGSRKSLLPPKY
jgi:hypothetical protein